ncbi:MAG TPA: sigma-54-dependent Fis family transcriptional regulator, partial [Desulfobulbaceae bacterium]|nr:sigma-54-dependent Fis family transcriptional regulator [Desulfobulbaceae bacterium]
QQDLPSDLNPHRPATHDKDEPVNLSSALAKTERQCVLAALGLTQGNRTKAAGLLGISRKNLWEKMKLHHIEL